MMKSCGQPSAVSDQQARKSTCHVSRDHHTTPYPVLRTPYSERGLALLPVLAGLGVLVLGATGIVTIFAQHSIRAATFQLLQLKNSLQIQVGLSAVEWRLAERVTQGAPMTAEELEIFRQTPFVIDQQTTITFDQLEDEGGKLNLNATPYVLPYLLEYSLGIGGSQNQELVRRHGEGLGLTKGWSSGKRVYYWRPDALLKPTSAKETLTLPTHAGHPQPWPEEEYHWAFHYRPARPARMESIWDLVNLWEGAFPWGDTDRVAWLMNNLSSAEEVGLNINTTSEAVLKSFVLWHNEASLSDPDWIARMKLSWEVDPASYGAFGWQVGGWMTPPDPLPSASRPTLKLRGEFVNNVKVALGGSKVQPLLGRTLWGSTSKVFTPYLPRDLNQWLGTYANFNTQGFKYLADGSDAMWFHLQGPGPYTAYSNHFSVEFELKGEGGLSTSRRVRAVLRVTPGGVAVREFALVDL